ncbi:MAG: DUF5753 domain-containing protein, partial [Candidatus Dormibacteraceae bacterium]
VLSKHDAPTYEVIVDEMVLRRPLGSHQIMARQLRTLTQTAERPNITLRVLPFVLGGHPGLDGSFHLMDFPRNRPVVHLEHNITGLFLEEPEQIDFYRQEAATLRRIALSPTESVDFVATIAHDHDRESDR